MFKVLDYSVEFPTTGRRFANRIEFEPGLTSITGRNEAGKTIILEMIRYCLFGKAALRGAAADYRELTASLTLMVGEQEVVISRSRRRETLTVAGAEAAVGADAINRAVPNLLGFGLDVFDISCAALQGDLGALTEMKPTARRAMVDKLIGLDRLEAVEAECRTEARAHSQLAEHLNLSLNPPEEPVEPEGYQPSQDLEHEIQILERVQNQRQQLLQIERPAAPEEPVAPEIVDVDMLEEYEENRQQFMRDRARVEGQLAAIPQLTVTPEQLEKAIRWRDTKREIERRGPRPEGWSDAQLDAFEEAWELIDRQSHDDLVTCPACDHQFDPHTGEAKIELPPEPPLVRTEIYEQRRRKEMWAEPLEPCEIVEVPDLDRQIAAWENRSLREELERQLALTVPEDRSSQLRAALYYQQQMAVYNSQMNRYDDDLARWQEAQELLASMTDPSEALARLRTLLVYARDYEQAQARYANELAHYESVMKRVNEAREKAQDFTNGSRALAATRVAVKAELAPSLSVAASSLLASMTGGERRRIAVDEDFNIVVDGQPLATLSGSGKSVVNLALRLGMGQILTSRVLPVFLGDEINADMDADRAGTTQQTMLALREYLKQIILVTHRDIDADHKIEL